MKRIPILIAAALVAAPLSVTVGGTTAGATSQRAATIIGAHAIDWPAANQRIGPLQDQRLFHQTSLPASFIGSDGDKLPAGVTAVISYKTQNTNVASFIRSIPANRPVIMIYHHEPENEYGGNGAQFVSEFVGQSKLIRANAKSNVRVAMAAETYDYTNGRPGVNCSFIPPASSLDFYLADHYRHNPNGTSLASDPKWVGWQKCVNGKGRYEGLAEYGLGNGTPPAMRAKTMAADDAYLKANHPHFYLWSYWYVGGDLFTDQATINEWKSIEAGN